MNQLVAFLGNSGDGFVQVLHIKHTIIFNTVSVRKQQERVFLMFRIVAPTSLLPTHTSAESPLGMMR